MDPLTAQIIIAFAFGVTFVVALMALAIKFPRPTPFQYNVFRIVLSLAAAGAAAMIPGFINIDVNSTTGLLIRAGGALAVFVIVSFLILPNSPSKAKPTLTVMTRPFHPLRTQFYNQFGHYTLRSSRELLLLTVR